MTPTLCPFCNAVLPSLTAAPTADKLPCPRCGELVPAERWRVDPAAQGMHAGPPPYSHADTPKANVPGLGKTAAVIMAVMLSMAIIGLGYMLWTTNLRRSRDPKALVEPITFRRPLELKGLGYLPKDSDLVIGLQIAEWLEDKKARMLLLEEPRPVPLDWVLKQVTRTSGMELKDLDHVLVAAAFDASFPQLTLVVRARRPISLEKIADARPAKSTLHQDQPLYHFTLNPAGEALVWCVDDKTAIYVVRFDTPKIEHLNALSKTPRKAEEVLSAPLREAMKERIGKHQLAWAVGRLDRLGAMKQALPFLAGGHIDASALKGLKTFAVGLEPIEGLTLTGHFQANDVKSAARLKTFLEGVKIDGASSQKVEAPPADVKEPWLTWQVRGDVAAMRDWLNADNQRKK